MSDPTTSIADGHCPRRLSTGSLVSDFVPKDFVMTGRSVASHQTTDMPDQTDPRALVATSDPPISRGAELSKEIVAELVRHALQVIRSTGEHLSIDDRIVLNGALAVMRQTADEIDNLLKADSSTSKRVTTRKK